MVDLTNIDGTTIDMYAVWKPSATVLPVRIIRGYAFNGWKYGDTFIGPGGSMYTPTADITL